MPVGSPAVEEADLLDQIDGLYDELNEAYGEIERLRGVLRSIASGQATPALAASRAL